MVKVMVKVMVKIRVKFSLFDQVVLATGSDDHSMVPSTDHHGAFEIFTIVPSINSYILQSFKLYLKKIISSIFFLGGKSINLLSLTIRPLHSIISSCW